MYSRSLLVDEVGVDVTKLGGINLDKSRARESRVYPGIEITRVHPPSSHSGDHERTGCDWLRPRLLASDWPGAWDHRSHLIRLINTTPNTLHRLPRSIREVRETKYARMVFLKDINQKSIYFSENFTLKSIILLGAKRLHIKILSVQKNRKNFLLPYSQFQENLDNWIFVD